LYTNHYKATEFVRVERWFGHTGCKLRVRAALGWQRPTVHLVFSEPSFGPARWLRFLQEFSHWK